MKFHVNGEFYGNLVTYDYETFDGIENCCDLAGAVFDACSTAATPIRRFQCDVGGGFGWACELRRPDEREVDQYGDG